MKKHLWFRAKNYGWGWYPSSWQGWLILLVYVGFLVYKTPSFYNIESLFATVLLIFICYKTGEKPEWRWGGKKTKKTK